jgi:hypothetical protein
MYRSYRPLCQYWEAFHAFARLVLLVLVSAFAPNPSLGAFYGLLVVGVVLVLWLVLEVVWKPWRELAFDHLQRFCYFTLLFNVCGGVVVHFEQLSTSPNQAMQGVVSALVLVVNAAFLFWAVVVSIDAVLITHNRPGLVHPGQRLSRLNPSTGWWSVMFKWGRCKAEMEVPIVHAGEWSLTSAQTSQTAAAAPP